VCVSNEINKPRSPSLKGVIAGKRAVIPTLTQETLGLAVLSPVLNPRRLTIPVVPPMQTELIGQASPAESGAALANRLREEGLI
jgi:electron transfer flavoprotein beta subunit